MRLPAGTIFALLLWSSTASAVTIDFEEFAGNTPGPIVSEGFLFDGTASDNKTFVGGFAGGTFGAVLFEHGAGQAFTLDSLDLLYLVENSPHTPWLGTLEVTGFYVGGGSIQSQHQVWCSASISCNSPPNWENVLLGGPQWSNLEQVRVDVLYFGCPEVCAVEIAVPIIDNVNVTAVPIPAAAWLFGSALAGLGWMRRKQTF